MALEDAETIDEMPPQTSLSAAISGEAAMKFTPLHDRVLVKRLEEESRSAGGIIIPDTAKEKPLRGRILAAGRGKVSEKGDLRPLAVKEGDTVLFGKYAGTEIKIDGEELTILREDDILGVLEG
jgi:chaperonin GroES